MSCSDTVEGELEAVGLGEAAFHSQPYGLAVRGNHPVPLKHLLPVVSHAGYVFYFFHVL